MSNVIVSQMDIDHLRVIRGNVIDFLKRIQTDYDVVAGLLLDIAPQDNEVAKSIFPKEVFIKTLDINPLSGCDYIGDICTFNALIPDSTFDFIVCTEVLEHTLKPWAAVEELYRILKSNGLLFVSVPYNFRIHGPLPDCWRFTEHGLRALFSIFEIVELTAIETPGRALMPIHYTLVAKKD